MQTSDMLSFIAICLTGFSILYTITVDIRNRRFTKNQDALNVRLLEKENEELSKQNAAEVNATIFKTGKDWTLKIFNKGNSAAKSVRWKFIGEDPSWFINDRLFPMEFLNAKQGVDLHVLIHSGSHPKAEIVIEWDDNNKKNNMWNAILTL
jgi:hypothetical protein